MSEPRSFAHPTTGPSLWSVAGRRLRRAVTAIKAFRNWPSVMAKFVLSWGGREQQAFEVRTRDGVAVRAPHRRSAMWPLIEVLGEDEYHVRHLDVSKLGPEPGVLDVGAHVGSFTCLLAHRLPGAVFTCIEPAAGAISWLENNLSRNGLGSCSTVMQAAVADTDGEATLWETSDASCDASLLPINGARVTTVPTLTFESTVATIGSELRVVKLDCEGGEYAAILESPRRCWDGVEYVFLEYHPVPDRQFTDIHHRFESLGFGLVWHELGPHPRTGLAHFARIPGPHPEAR